jgi:hypothetical protein
MALNKRTPSTVVNETADLARLRRWTIEQLRAVPGSAPSNDSWLASITEDSWRTFFKLERCASPLLSALKLRPRRMQLPEPIMLRVRTEAARELESVLMAEMDIRWLAMIAADTGARPIALKGVVPVLYRGAPVLHLADVDLLATAADAEVLSEKLQAAGFTAAINNEPHHVHWNPPKGHLPIEIHHTLFADGSPIAPELWRRVEDAESMRGMLRLAYSDQVVHALSHALVQHNDRHVRIRDVLLLSWLLSRLNENELDAVRASINALPSSRRFQDLLDFAASFNALGRESRVPDPFENDVILFFAAGLLADQGHLWAGGPSLAWHRAASVAAGTTSVIALTKFGGRNPVTGIETFVALQKKTASAGRAITRFGRAVLYFTSATLCSPYLLAIRAKVKRRLTVQTGGR